MTKIVLIGYRASGKTSVGSELAEKLVVPFFDTDELVFKFTGRTVKQIVEDEGWEAFREAECRVIRKLAEPGSFVIALGGGVVMDEKNVEILKKNAFFIWLSADIEKIMERMIKDGYTESQRPALSDKDSVSEVEKILRERIPVYKRTADWTIDTSEYTVGEITGEIILAVEKGKIPWGTAGKRKGKGLICRETR
ncbi:MAG: shikimate kinase [Syntrophales bacterium]|jgi:shikimate kinase